MTRMDKFLIGATVASAIALVLLFSVLAHADGVTNPVTPGYVVCNTNSGATQCGWQADQTTTPLPVQPSYLYNNITTDTTTVVKTGAGVLHSITINGPTAAGVITLFDNTAASGTKIGTITVPASPQAETLLYDVAFTTGLTILTATQTEDLTVSYR
jgi:hypothetical protein